MISVKDNKGMTLLELVVAIFIGTIITTAAVTILLLGLRLYKQSNDSVNHQNRVRVGITVIEELVKKTPASEIKDLLVFKDGILQISTGGQVMEGVTDFDISFDTDNENLVIINLEVDEEPYELRVLSMVKPEETAENDNPLYPSLGEQENANPASESPGEGGAVKSAGFEIDSSENVMETAIGNRELTANVRAFLKTLNSQMGSTGRILKGEEEGEYYSEWYIGSFAENPGWSADTPWCACFISWALEECGGYLKGQILKFANVDSFLAEFVTTDMWKTENPEPGNIIFFDWIVDDENDAQHVGVVISADEDWIYTIEGNSNGRVEICKYNAGDRRILGYGILNWT